MEVCKCLHVPWQDLSSRGLFGKKKKKKQTDKTEHKVPHEMFIKPIQWWFLTDLNLLTSSCAYRKSFLQGDTRLSQKNKLLLNSKKTNQNKIK